MIDFSKLRIVTYPHKSLKKVADPVLSIDEQSKLLSDRMFTLLHQMKGIGLAAPQIGISLRIFIIDISGILKETFINPVIVNRSEEKEIGEEGCLSLPGKVFLMYRDSAITAEYQDLNGLKKIIDLEGLAARCFQHELDHLNGKLLIETGSLLPSKRSH